MACEYHCTIEATNGEVIEMKEALDGGITWLTVISSEENTHMNRVSGAIKAMMVTAFDAHVDSAVAEMKQP